MAETLFDVQLLDGATITVTQVFERHYEVRRNGRMVAIRKTEQGAAVRARHYAAKYDLAYRLRTEPLT